MNRSTCFSVLLIGLLGLLACQPDSGSHAAARPESFSASFEPSEFSDDDRIEKISSLAPRIQELMVEHMEARHIPGVAWGIVVDDSLIIASANGLINREQGIQATTRSSFRIASMTKSFTAMAILKLRDEGRLSLEDPVSLYVPEMANLEYPTSDAPVIDIENLLTMTAGFPEDNPWGDRQLHEPDQMLLEMVAQGISFSSPTSTQYEYSNTGYAILGYLVSRISGIPYQDYIREEILEPLGMRETYWEFDNVPDSMLAIGYRWEEDDWVLEPMLHHGAFGAMGGLITSIEDFAKYVSFHLSAWPPRSDPDDGPVKRSSLREMHTPQFARLNATSRNFAGEACPSVGGYGFGLGIYRDCAGLVRVSHGGALPGYGSNYSFFPDLGIGLMAFGNLTYTSPWPFQEIGRLLFETIELPRRELPVSDILAQRKEEVADLIQEWNPVLEEQVLAENFYMDQSRESRMERIGKLLDRAGECQEAGEITPFNQLRGRFAMQCEMGTISVFFTLTPERDPKVQQINVSFSGSR